MKNCPKCSKPHSKPGTFCSRTCANSRGPRTVDFKLKVSYKLTGRKMPEEQKEKIRGDNHPHRRGKNLPPLEKTCLYCGIKFHRTSGTFCSLDCWKMLKQQQKTAWENYKTKCRFTFNVYDYPDLFDLSLIESYGWYEAKNRGDNSNGISRDHMYSVREGFINNIDPRIISHPVNCNLIRHRDNQKKYVKSSITIEELESRIQKFNGVMAE